VPSYWEIAKLWSMFNNSVDEIHKNLLLPFDGYRGFNDAIVYNLWSWANLDTSSPNFLAQSQTISQYNKWTSLCITGMIGIWTAPHTNGVSLRCFYNYYDSYQKQVQCLESWYIPFHSHYDVENVTITWNNETGWSEPENCNFACDEWYYWDNCEISIIHDTWANIEYWLNATDTSSWEHFTW
jgi:hypothetical protein